MDDESRSKVVVSDDNTKQDMPVVTTSEDISPDPTPAITPTPADTAPIPQASVATANEPLPSTPAPQPTPAVASSTAPLPSLPAQTSPRHHPFPMRVTSFAVVALVVAAGIFLAGYAYGKKSMPMQTNSNAMTASLQVPAGATVISQCSVGLGTQYVLPKNIPQGPIYNVYQGKVIGLEFMVPESTSTSSSMSSSMSMDSSNTTTLNLYNMQYDHINVSLMPQGHAGLAVPHYMADVMMAPTSTTNKITCSSNSSTSNSTMSTSGTTSSSSMQ